MNDWYRQISKNILQLPACIDFFNNELDEAKKELSLYGATLEKHAANLPAITESRYSQLQEIEAILEFLNIEYRKKRSIAYKKYTINYEKTLSTREVDKYVDGDDDVIAMAILVNEFALLRNKYLALHKGLETKHWQLANIIKLRTAGLDDATIG